MKYVLLFVDTEQFANDLQAMGPAERERAYDRVHEWYANQAGTIWGGSKLRQSPTRTPRVKASPPGALRKLRGLDRFRSGL